MSAPPVPGKDDDVFLNQVREAVTIRTVSPTKDKHARRGMTEDTAKKPSSPPLPRRSQSDLSPTTGRLASNPFASPDRSTKDKNVKDKSKKKGSRHADVIDSIDKSGWLGGVFHHDSPYDAAAPSRNTGTDTGTSPMRAFQSEGPLSTQEAPLNGKLSALATKTLKSMQEVTFSPDQKDATQKREVSSSYDSATPSLFFGSSSVPRSAPPSGGGFFKNRLRSLSNPGPSDPKEEDYMNGRAKAQKNALASAWGVQDPEPFEDFGWAASSKPMGETGLASASSSIWNGHEGRSAPAKKDGRIVEIGDDVNANDSDAQEDLLDEPIHTISHSQSQNFRPSHGRTRSSSKTFGLGPPSPGLNGYGESNGGSGLKRNKSLIQRIKNMRDNPNVPLNAEDLTPGSDQTPMATSPNRPNYFSRKSTNKSNSSESFVFVDALANDPVPAPEARERRPYPSKSSTRDKSLPRLPSGQTLADENHHNENPFADATTTVHTPPLKSPPAPSPIPVPGAINFEPGSSRNSYFGSSGSGSYKKDESSGLSRKGSLLERVRGLKVRG